MLRGIGEVFPSRDKRKRARPRLSDDHPQSQSLDSESADELSAERLVCSAPGR
jgi:hypothetical protein